MFTAFGNWLRLGLGFGIEVSKSWDCVFCGQFFACNQIKIPSQLATCHMLQLTSDDWKTYQRAEMAPGNSSVNVAHLQPFRTRSFS